MTFSICGKNIMALQTISGCVFAVHCYSQFQEVEVGMLIIAI